MQNNNIKTILEKSSAEHQKKTRRKRLFTTLAAIVVFCTTYALIIPAITWERTLICEKPEHTHTSECYQLVTRPKRGSLLCTEAEHTHTDECYEDVTTLVCTLPGSSGHTHGEGCYISDGK